MRLYSCRQCYFTYSCSQTWIQNSSGLWIKIFIMSDIGPGTNCKSKWSINMKLDKGVQHGFGLPNSTSSTQEMDK